MKQKLLKVMSLLLCAVMCMSSCSGDKDDTSASSDTVTDTSAVTPSATEDVNLISENFEGLEEKEEGGASFSFISDGDAKILRQERSSFSDSAVPTFEGKKWDSASNSWVTASDIQTKIATYTVGFNRDFTGGNLVVEFQFKRSGGKSQVLVVRPSGLGTSDVGVFVEGDELSIGDGEMKITSTHIKKTDVPAEEWCNISIVYTLERGKMGVMAVINDTSGTVLASVALDGLATAAVKKISGVDFVDLPYENFADYGEANPVNTTSVWCVKELTVQSNPLKTGDIITAKRQNILTDTNTDISFLSIGGFHTIRPYLGQSAFLPDNSGMICGTADGSFYRYDFATSMLTYLDRTSLYQEHLGQEFSAAERGIFSVNPQTGNVFYFRTKENGNTVLCKINPQTLEKTDVYVITDSKMEVQLSTTYDEKYTSYQIGGMANANVEMEIGRINLETGEIDARQKLTYNDKYAVNHVIINPVYPDLILFHRESHVGENVHDHTNVLNVVTGVKTTYAQPGDGSAHTLWVYGGEYISTTDNVGSSWYISVLTKDLKTTVYSQVMAQGNHCMVDESLEWVVGDNTGICLRNTQDKTFTMIVKNQILKLDDPYDGHPEISKDGTLISWGFVDSNGVVGVAWMTNPKK